MLADIGFTDVNVGAAVDTFGGAHGEPNARTFDVNGYPFIARKPTQPQDGEDRST